MQDAGFRTSDAPDVVLPSQYFGAKGGGALCGEQRLMLAVLVDAINILQGRGPMAGARRRRILGEAAEWVIMKGTRYPFSFDSVCDALNIVPEWLRGQLCDVALRHGPIGWERPRRLRLRGSSRSRRMTPNRVRGKRSTLSRDGDYGIDTGNALQNDLCVR
jgi:hypothetical protein